MLYPAGVWIRLQLSYFTHLSHIESHNGLSGCVRRSLSNHDDNLADVTVDDFF